MTGPLRLSAARESELNFTPRMVGLKVGVRETRRNNCGDGS